MAEPSQAPRMGPEDRRVVRNKYRSMEYDIAKNSEMMMTVQNGQLQQAISDANALHRQVTKPREHAIDANVFKEISIAGARATERLVNRQAGRTVNDFVIALRHLCVHTSNPQEDGANAPTAFQWQELSDRVAAAFREAPGASCMLGAMDMQAKVRKAAARRQERPKGEVVRPEEVERIEEQDKQETDRNMEEMYEVLERLGSCPAAELVCNHRCFAQTVENMFTLSFLVRDSKVFVWHDEERGLMVRHVSRSHAAPAVPGKRPDEQLQFVLSATVEDWEVMKKVVSTRDTKMKHRDQSHLMALNAATRGAAVGTQHADIKAEPARRDGAGPSGAQAAPSARPSRHDGAGLAASAAGPSGTASQPSSQPPSQPPSQRRRTREAEPISQVPDDDDDNYVDLTASPPRTRGTPLARQVKHESAGNKFHKWRK